MAQPGILDIVARVLVGELLELAVQVGAAYADFLRYQFHGQFRIGELGRNEFLHFHEQFVVGRFHFHCPVVHFQFSRIFVAHGFPQFYQLADAGAQMLDVERLWNVGVCTSGNALDTLFDGCLRRQYYHRNVAGGRIGLYPLAHFRAVHFRHHYVGDYAVGQFAYGGLQSLHAVGRTQDIVFRTQDFSKIIED